MSKTTVALIAFLTGCGAAAIAPLVIPPAHAQTTQRWEGYCVTEQARSPGPRLTSIANTAGREGWELVAMTHEGQTNVTNLCFKRPAP